MNTKQVVITESGVSKHGRDVVPPTSAACGGIPALPRLNIVGSAVARFCQAAFAAVVSIALCCGEALAGRELSRNPPSACSGPGNRCGCPEKKVTAKCIKATVDLGETTPWTGSLECSLKIFADDDSPSIFTADSLFAVLGGYTFKRLGTQNLADGATPAEVVFSHPNGEPVHFVFAEGESLGRPDPGVHIKMDERLMMVDAEGWATTSDPVYYDLYIGDGSRRRFLATNMTGALGQLVSITDARGVTTTPTDMGVDIVYDSNGVRQYLTPSRLADVTHASGFTGYDVTVYALQEVPAKDAQTGLYAVPATQPAERLSIQRENDGKRAVVTVQKGGGEALRYVFDYAMGEWSLTRPSGAQELRERHIADEREAKIVTSYVSSHGERLEHTEYNYKWESWGFAMTNKVEGFDGVTDTTEWTYYTSGNGKGQIKAEKRQSGLLTQYTYDSVDRVISETRSGPDMMTEVTTYDYTPVDPSDQVLPVDTRPRTVVRKLNNIECERTYYVYSPLTNIVERVGTQGAAFGGTNALRTVTAFYPAVANDVRSGLVASVRHEDGKLDVYDYSLVSNLWVETVTYLHEQSPSPISGKTTRDITLTNARSQILEEKTEAFIDGIWYTIARNRMTYNEQGKRITSENLAGQVTTTAWDCCHKVSETGPDGSATTWDYDDEGRVIASSRLIPLDMTNVTWLTTCYQYDALGRQISTWKTNLTQHIGTPVISTQYDPLGRVVAKSDAFGNWTRKSYCAGGLSESTTYPNGSTHVVVRDQGYRMLTVTGTAVTPEFHAYGVTADGSVWTRINKGSASSPRFSKVYRNFLGVEFREEKSGCNGSTVASVHIFDSCGNVVSTVSDRSPAVSYEYDEAGVRIGIVRSADGCWRRDTTSSLYRMIDGDIWKENISTQSCSDVAIAPIVSSRQNRFTGLSAVNPTTVRVTDIRGNTTEKWISFDSGLGVEIEYERVPYATGVASSFRRFGMLLRSVSVSSVTNSTTYDGLGRMVTHTDGRGNTTVTAYNAVGKIESVTDEAGSITRYAYDRFGRVAAVTNALGVATVFEYDVHGNRIYEGGATYPVRYAYDIYNTVTNMTTYRNEASGVGDSTAWRYDEASGVLLQKIYADGNGPSYTYNNNGQLATRTWARGVTATYAYDGWGNLTNTCYSDGTPSVSIVYDAMGRQSAAHDAAGTTRFAYDKYGQNTNEVTALAGIARIYDAFGRNAGYVHTSGSMLANGYDPDSGRLGSASFDGVGFTYSYVPGSDLEAAIAGPGFDKIVAYDSRRDLIASIAYTNSNLISLRSYGYDIGGNVISRTQKRRGEPDRKDIFANDVRGQLTNAVFGSSSYAYSYDDIGNRNCSFEVGTNVVYAVNGLNQYTNILGASQSAAFVPEYDADGNQTFLRTSTGDWRVTYNAENRPVIWTCGATNILMTYDRMGRRLEKTIVEGGVAVKSSLFAYDGYLQVAEYAVSNGQTSTVARTFWDPSEPIATRPLAVKDGTGAIRYYAVDLTKNVCEVLDADLAITARCEYSPFGVASVSGGAPASGFRWSSEYNDDDLKLTYYNYRHYDGRLGRWLSRDSILIDASNLYLFAGNKAISSHDILGGEACESLPECALGPSWDRWPYYGDWGGPGWASGRYVTDGWMNRNPEYLEHGSIDALDYCYYKHDICYEECRNKHQAGCCRDACLSKCDLDAVICQSLALLNPFDPLKPYGYGAGPLGIVGLGGQGALRMTKSGVIAAGGLAADAANKTVDIAVGVVQTLGEGVAEMAKFSATAAKKCLRRLELRPWGVGFSF